ncbi:stAR-related lipid transfer protein 7, mitochondrial isoform X1 [Xyrauchen texanus]|uniref:stAR-related lipid transfer protein 7, mitochondrial isoform X1 n=2 Tax=Xyrauchen texanus TaxID=154827 RepID=UPI0022419058|nr:stAR-related lipid transfer protein 7, mitochondrial isoform X1 [Xyrauchen texanus]
MDKKRWSSGATKRKAKKEKDSREVLIRSNIPAISTFFKSWLDENKEPGGAGACGDAEFSTISSFAILDEPEHQHQHQHDKTENPSPPGVTDTYSNASPPPQSPTPLETETEAGAEGGRDPAVTCITSLTASKYIYRSLLLSQLTSQEMELVFLFLTKEKGGKEKEKEERRRRRGLQDFVPRGLCFLNPCLDAIGKMINTSWTFSWMGQRVGLLLSWFQKAGRETNKLASNKKKERLLSIFANHCSFVTGQRLRRAFQIGELYSNLYSERTRWTLAGSIWRRLQSKHAPAGKLIAALAGDFMWEDEKIRDDELRRCALELQALEGVRSQSGVSKAAVVVDPGWEVVMEKKNFRVWRRPIQGSHLFEYRVFGSYTDVTPRQFFNVQLDTEYRKKWDALVIKLEVVDRDVNTGTEVVHWATRFPYPMYSRDYVYVRRYHFDVENSLMILVSRAVNQPSVPETQEFVRINSYQSKMVIRPHRSFDENGFDYLLTYSDDPQTVFPRYCVSWMVSSGMPDFLEKLHTAALRAKNMDVDVQDYVSIVKPIQSTQERLGADNPHTGGPSQIYA